MTQNHFIWADLSSYEPEKTKQFYESVFNWAYYKYDNYYTAYKDAKEVVGLYETPQKFKEMRMPSFWMSYIKVDGVSKTVEKAKELGGIIEFVDLNTPTGAMALIRDTLGAGFTIYEGNMLNSKTLNESDTLIYNELHISDSSKIIPFYENLFNWTIKKVDAYTFDVFDKETGESVCTIRELDNYIKGKYEYWTCVFGVKNLEEKIKLINRNGGLIISKDEKSAMCSDGSEAFFIINEI